jgi:hypothetical protein
LRKGLSFGRYEQPGQYASGFSYKLRWLDQNLNKKTRREKSTSGEQGPPARSERTNTAGLARQNSKKLHDSILTD